MDNDGAWEVRGRTKAGTRQAALDAIAALSVEPAVVEAVELQAVLVGETPAGHREFHGFRRWLRDRAKVARVAEEAHATSDGANAAADRAEECEAILSAVSDYWLGPEEGVAGAEYLQGQSFPAANITR